MTTRPFVGQLAEPTSSGIFFLHSATPNTIAVGSVRDIPAPIVRGVSPVISTTVDVAPDRVESLTVLIPVMNEEGNLDELHSRLTTVLSATDLFYEIIFVDDGSTDATWNVITRLRATDTHVIGLKHRRNFGKAEALTNGFHVSRGDVVITMDGDLQDDPDELPRFLEMIDQGYDLVSGWKQRRQDPLGKTAPSKVFNWTVRKTTGVDLHDFNCGFKAYRRDAAASIDLYGELHRFTPVLAHAEGFRIGELPVKHHARTWGSSKYGWSRLTKGFLDLLTVVFLTKYRQRPMHLFGLPGLLSLALGVVIGLWLTFSRIVLDEQIGTRPALQLAVLLVVIGAQFFGLGLIGEFMAHSSNSNRLDRRNQLRQTIGLSDLPLVPVAPTTEQPA
jgi:glycosyltransferase involved in cell wall biosynthesis